MIDLICCPIIAMMSSIVPSTVILLAGQAAARPVPPPPPPPTYMTVDCDVAIVGAGVGGLVMSYRLAPLYGAKLCVVDERDYTGGKVHSIRYTRSSDARPVWTPTHAEQWRGGDSILRCMAQEVGSPTVARGTPGIFYDYLKGSINATGYQCFGNSTPTGSATCRAGYPWDGYFAPNGYRYDATSNLYGAMPNPCGNKDWTECSYTDEYYLRVTSDSAANSIAPGESFEQYIRRILGTAGANYFSDHYGYSYMNMFDARYMVEYLKYDWTFPYGHVHMSHGGPQASMLSRVANLIAGNGSRILLNTHVNSVDWSNATDTAAGYRYTLLTDTLLKVRAKRTVLAFPPGHLASMGGALLETLKGSDKVKYAIQNHACTVNAFFRDKWWYKHTAACNFGWCAFARGFNMTGYARDHYMGWNYADVSGSSTSIEFIQYVPTPERQEGNLLRFFFAEEPCRLFDEVYAASGTSGVVAEIMERLQVSLGGGPDLPNQIPSPTEAYYSSEKFAYAGFAAGAPFTAVELLKWAAEPLPGEKLCFVSEGFNGLDSGWQEGAAIAAHNCLKSNVFKDAVPQTAMQALERCRANITNGANRYLDSGNKNSGNDVCLLMQHEYHIRDLAGYTYCGGPKVYDYPTYAELVNGSYAADEMQWSSATSNPVYERRQCRGRYCI